VVEPLRIVQVGLGDWGRDWAWRITPAVPEVEVVGYVDSDPGSLELLSKKVPAAEEVRFGTLEDALDAGSPDAVLVTTTLAGHAPLIRASLEAGLHVLVEKPFAESLETAADLVTLAAAKRRVLMVSQNYRFFPAPRAAAALVSGSDLGELYEVAIDFRRNNASPPKTRFRQHWDPQPLLVDMSVHHFDLLRMMFGGEPERMSCITAGAGRGGFDGPPVAMASILFGDVPVSYDGLGRRMDHGVRAGQRLVDEPRRRRSSRRPPGDHSAQPPAQDREAAGGVADRPRRDFDRVCQRHSGRPRT
jgi:predicted dehydrogenase